MEGALVIGLILNIISMIACPIIGGNKGRSVVGWFFGGLFLSVIGLIIVSCLKEIPTEGINYINLYKLPKYMFCDIEKCKLYGII